MQSAVQIKVSNSSITCIKCADKERFKTRVQRVAFRVQLRYLLVVVVVSDVRVVSSTVAVISAVN